jgi:hypothetical protein
MQIMFAKTTLADASKRDLLAKYRAEFAALPTGLAPAVSGVVERASVVHLVPRITVSDTPGHACRGHASSHGVGHTATDERIAAAGTD